MFCRRCTEFPGRAEHRRLYLCTTDCGRAEEEEEEEDEEGVNGPKQREQKRGFFFYPGRKEAGEELTVYKFVCDRSIVPLGAASPRWSSNTSASPRWSPTVSVR